MPQRVVCDCGKRFISPAAYKRHRLTLCKAAPRAGMPTELLTLARHKRQRQYPLESIRIETSCGLALLSRTELRSHVVICARCRYTSAFAAVINIDVNHTIPCTAPPPLAPLDFSD